MEGETVEIVIDNQAIKKPAETEPEDAPATKKVKVDEAPVELATVEAAADADIEPTKEVDTKAIIDQIEYYFGDANLFRDKFLQTEIEKNEGWVPIVTLTTFKRLATLSTDVKSIADALDTSDSGLIEISEDRQNVRRHPERPLPEKNEETRKEAISRTAYVKGFPVELDMPQIIEFFKDYPKVAHVVIRKYLDKPTKTYKSKGSVFVTFSTRDQCAAFLSQDAKYNELPLIAKWQSDYYAEKKTERQDRQKEKNARNEPNIELPTGTVLHLTNIKTECDVTREAIKEAFEKFEAEVAFVEFKKGDEEAWVRLSNENAAKELLAKLNDGKTTIADVEVSVRVLDGEEETKYLAECVEKMKERRKQGNRNKNHRKR